MRRRDIIALLGGVALARPLAAEAQQAGKVYRIGYLSQGEPPRAWVEALQQGLRERGYVEGRNLVWDSGRPTAAWTNFRDTPRSWCGRRWMSILARASSAALAAKDATSSVPIVFAGVPVPS